MATLTFFLLGLAQPAAATDFYKNFLILTTPKVNKTEYFYTDIKNTSPFGSRLQGAHIDGPDKDKSFDRAGQLLIGGEANTFSDNGDNIYTPQMYYRVYLQGTSQAAIDNLAFTPLTLNFKSAGEDGNSTNKKWTNTTTNSNILDATSGPGTYVLEVYYYFFATYNNLGGSGSFTRFDSRGSQNYKATFDVSGDIPRAWNGTQSDDWFDDRNWSPNGQPTAATDVVIPYSESARFYPTIRSGIASVRTLSIQGNNNTLGAHNYMQGGELRIFGDFRDPNNGFNQTGGLFTLAGTTPQTFDGGSFFNVSIQGGSVKTLTNSMDIFTSLLFVNGGGILTTSTFNSATFKVDLGSTAQVTGESETSYVQGFLRARTLDIAAGETYTFGNVGLDITPTTGRTGATLVTRLTGSSNAGVGDKGASITRSFAVLPDNPNNLNYTLTFHYLNAELNGNGTTNLVLFRSLNGTTSFESLNKTSSGANTVTRTAISGTLATGFTLAEAAPLPVTLVSFTAAATAQGTALLRWTTASETNNKGFGIERQLASGDTWQSVGYLASGNNATGGTYEYTDKSLASATASPQAYYRLRQEDQDGKLSYSPVAVVARPTVVASTALMLSPVPVTGASISLAFAEASQAGSEISIINTQGQHLLRYTTEASDNAALSLPIERLAAGVYIVSVRVPGQAVRHARFVKL